MKNKIKKTFIKIIHYLLCANDIMFSFVDTLTKGTQTKNLPFPEGMGPDPDWPDDMRCWCCTFWRGVVFGGVFGFAIGATLHFKLAWVFLILVILVFIAANYLITKDK